MALGANQNIAGLAGPGAPRWTNDCPIVTDGPTLATGAAVASEYTYSMIQYDSIWKCKENRSHQVLIISSRRQRPVQPDRSGALWGCDMLWHLTHTTFDDHRFPDWVRQIFLLSSVQVLGCNALQRSPCTQVDELEQAKYIPPTVSRLWITKPVVRFGTGLHPSLEKHGVTMCYHVTWCYRIVCSRNRPQNWIWICTEESTDSGAFTPKSKEHA